MDTPELPHQRTPVPRTITPQSTPAVDGLGILRFPLRQDALAALVRSALDEDGAFNDLTTIATVVTPAANAHAMTSPGVSVPSEKTECACRSIVIDAGYTTGWPNCI